MLHQEIPRAPSCDMSEGGYGTLQNLTEVLRNLTEAVTCRSGGLTGGLRNLTAACGRLMEAYGRFTEAYRRLMDGLRMLAWCCTKRYQERRAVTCQRAGTEPYSSLRKVDGSLWKVY